MKFYSLLDKNTKVTNLEEEYKNAYPIDNIRLGNQNLFFRSGFKTYFIPYDKVYRYFRRVKLVPARFCCGRFNLEVEHLVLCNKKRELAEIQLSGKRSSQALMKKLKELMPNAKVGIKKEREKKLKQAARGTT